jgi:hypothetical protein
MTFYSDEICRQTLLELNSLLCAKKEIEKIILHNNNNHTVLKCKIKFSSGAFRSFINLQGFEF